MTYQTAVEAALLDVRDLRTEFRTKSGTVTAVDVTIQAQIVELLKDLTSEAGAAMLFITHDLGLVARFAHRVAVMYAGRIVEFGPVGEIFRAPRHPYIQSLLATIPGVGNHGQDRLPQIPGTPPDMRHPPKGCAFKERCLGAHARCHDEAPTLSLRDTAHSAACWLPAGLEKQMPPPPCPHPKRCHWPKPPANGKEP